METMTAILPEETEIHNIKESARKAHDRQPMVQYIGAHYIEGDNLHEVVSTKVFRAFQGSVTTVILWVYGKDKWISASGRAGGYGYHKGSAALQEAIDNSKIKISESINGRGDVAMEMAIEAIAKALYPDKQIFMKRVWG